MTQPRSTPGTTRRTVLRVSGITAWTAPVVIAAGSVPAFAASGTVRATQSAVRSGPDNIGEGVDFNATIFNDTADAVTLSVRLTAISQGNTWNDAYFADGSIGWSLIGFEGFGTATVTIDWQGGSPIASGGSATFHELLGLTPSSTYTPGTVSLTLMPAAPATATQPAPASYAGGAARSAGGRLARGASGPTLVSGTFSRR